MKHSSVTNIISFLLLGLAAFALLRFPRDISQAVRDALNLCFDTLLPNLFPFLVLSSLVVKLGVSQLFGRLFAPIMGLLFHLPGYCATPLVLGLLAGYPTGAKIVISMYQAGQCTKNEAQRLLSFCVNCGPAFLIGAVGCGVFNEKRYGLLLAGVHLLSAISVGIMMNHSYCTTKSLYIPEDTVQPFVSAFVSSVTGSLYTFIELCSFVLSFSAITSLLKLSGLIDVLVHGSISGLAPQNISALMIGLLEMTNGVTNLSPVIPKESLVLAAGLLAWGGLSVHFQVIALLQDTGLSPASYFKGKTFQALFSMFLMWSILQKGGWVYLLAAIVLLSVTLWTPKKEVEIPKRILYNGHRKTREL